MRNSMSVLRYGVNATDCEHNLLADFHATMVPRFEHLLTNNYKILIYNGQVQPFVYSYVIGY